MALLGNAASGNQILAQDLLAGVVAQSYLMSGTTPSTSANVTLTFGQQEAVVNNGTLAQYVKLAAGTLVLPASQDNYLDVGYSGPFSGGVANGVLTNAHVANGAAVPALTVNSIRLWKVVTSASAITAVTPLANTYPVGPSLVGPGLKANAPTSPSVAPSTSAGTGATAALSSGNDTCGIITVNTGTGTAAQNVLATVTFGTALVAAPRLVIITPYQNVGDAVNSALLGLYAYNYTTTGFYVETANAPTASSTYRFGFLVIQ